MSKKMSKKISRYELRLLILQMDNELHNRGCIANTTELTRIAKRIRKEHKEEVESMRAGGIKEIYENTIYE